LRAEDTVTGFLLAGIGQRDAAGANFLVVDAKMAAADVAAFFTGLLARGDVGLIIVSQPVADMIRATVAAHTATIPMDMSSVNAILAIPNQVPYVISKGGVNQLTKVMAVSLAAHGIRVNAIGPGTIATELARKAVMGSPAAERTIMSRTPLGRLGEPSEVATVAAFLASDDASYLSGQTIYPDGGRLALNYLMPTD
jgi:ATP synthase F subunit